MVLEEFASWLYYGSPISKLNIKLVWLYRLHHKGCRPMLLSSVIVLSYHHHACCKQTFKVVCSVEIMLKYRVMGCHLPKWTIDVLHSCGFMVLNSCRLLSQSVVK